MKTMDRLYERLTPTERFTIAVAAFGRGDLLEVDRLNDSTNWRTIKIQEPAYFDRLQRITSACPVLHRPCTKHADHGPCSIFRNDHPPASVG